MSRHYIYDPPDSPVVGGIAATINPGLRKATRQSAIEAAKRVLPTQPFDATGDVAFDIRAKTFRDALAAGTPQAFEESPEAFKAVGLYWQGTYGDPTKTEGFKDPPTNAQSKYNPGMWDLSVSKELQDWAVKDFNYAAWLYVKDTDPYVARAMYIKLSDEILKKIPGPHLEVMDKWPKWSNKGSPPVPGGLYPNPKYVPGYKPKQRSKTKPVKPKPESPKKQPAVSGSPEGPTLVEKPVPSGLREGTITVDGVSVEIKAVEESPAKEMLPDYPADGPSNEGQVNGLQATEDSTKIPDPVPLLPPQPGIKLPDSAPIQEPLSSTALPVQSSEVDVKEMLLPLSGAEAPDEIASVTSSSESLNLEAAMGEIKGLRPDLVTIGNAEKRIESPSEMAKHFIIMGGIGVGVGALFGAVATAFKYLRIWPFNKKASRPRKHYSSEAETEEAVSKVKRSHARAWTRKDTA